MRETQLELARCYLVAGDIKRVKKDHEDRIGDPFHGQREVIPGRPQTIRLHPNREASILAGILGLTDEIVATAHERNQFLQQIVATINQTHRRREGGDTPRWARSRLPTLTLRASKNLTVEQVYHRSFSSRVKS